MSGNVRPAEKAKKYQGKDEAIRSNLNVIDNRLYVFVITSFMYDILIQSNVMKHSSL